MRPIPYTVKTARRLWGRTKAAASVFTSTTDGVWTFRWWRNAVDAVFVVAGHFNHCNLRTVLPKYHQHVSVATRENNILDHVYSNVKGAYKAAPRPTSDSRTTSLCSSAHLTGSSSNRPLQQVKLLKYGTKRLILCCRTALTVLTGKTAALREDCTVDL